MNAYQELKELFEPGEHLVAVVFGPWGWGGPPPHPEDPWKPGYDEPDPPPVPFALRGKVLSPQEAEPLMEGWSFNGGHGAPKCYAVHAWTNKRVYWVTQYDGATRLNSALRDPTDEMPDMPGG